MANRKLVSRWTRREVFSRDGAQCTWSTNGERCWVMEDLALMPEGDIPPGFEDDPCQYSLMCPAHAALRELDVPDPDWAHA